MKNLSLIAAIGENNELGKDNKLIWYLKEDLKFFKEQTMGKTIIMGRNTFESLPGILKGRHHIVLTRNNLNLPNEVDIFHDYESLKEYIANIDEEMFVIGGASVYRLFLNDVDKMLLTEISAKDDMADAYFPEFDKNDWDKEVLSSHNDNGISYNHVKYLRKKMK